MRKEDLEGKLKENIKMTVIETATPCEGRVFFNCDNVNY